MNHETRLDIPPVRADGLQLNEPRPRQQRYWRVQRVAWWTFGAVMLMAILGLTGSGGMFQIQTIRFAHATIEVPRISRWQGADAVTVTFHGGADAQEVTVTQPFFDRFTIERIQPEPDQSLLLTGAQSLRFPANAEPPHTVTLSVRAAQFGWTSFEMTIGGETRRINLLVLP